MTYSIKNFKEYIPCSELKGKKLLVWNKASGYYFTKEWNHIDIIVGVEK